MMDDKQHTAHAGDRGLDRRRLFAGATAGLTALVHGGTPIAASVPRQVAPPTGADAAEARSDTTLGSHHTAFVNGVPLHFIMAGAGDPVVLLHGWPQTWYQWRRVIPVLAERYTVIAPDLRGYADSGKPDGP